MRKVAFITGITGQDGSYLAERLIEDGYLVHGLIRRNSSSDISQRINELIKNPSLTLHYGDLHDFGNLMQIMSKIKPSHVFNLAAQSHVKVSFESSIYTADINALGTLRLLEAIRCNNLNETRFYQASTSELYGKVHEIPQRVDTPFHPRSPYGVSKLFAHWITKNYRESYDMFASSGILFNHESPRRGETFVTRKITLYFARLAHGLIDKPLELGNLNAFRDWGHAKDYVDAMIKIINAKKPKDYVVSMDEQHSVKEFCEKAASFFGIDLSWKGSDINEEGWCLKTNRQLIKVNADFYRPAEVDSLIGDSSVIRKELNWSPKYSFDGLVEDMCKSDFELIKRNS